MSSVIMFSNAYIKRLRSTGLKFWSVERIVSADSLILTP